MCPGAGVAYEQYGAEVRDCIAGLNRPLFANDLAYEWLACLPDIRARLVAGTPMRVLDVACGTGWSAISLARAYPQVTVTGIDPPARVHVDALEAIDGTPILDLKISISAVPDA